MLRGTRGALPAALVLLALAAVVEVDAIVTPITFTPPRYLATDVPLRITIKGYNFNNNTRIRLSNNFSKCDVGTLFTPNQRPYSTIGPIVQWTPHDPSTFFVADFGSTNVSQSQIFVCYSRNGRQWYQVTNGLDRAHFRLFKKMPVATAAPRTAVVGRPLYVEVSNIPPGSRGALVTRISGCDGRKPDFVLRTTEGNITVLPADLRFRFTPFKKATTAYLCVASPDVDDWSLVPFDPNGVMVWPYDGRPLTGTVLSNEAAAITVYDSTVAWRRARLTWTPALIAGVTATASIRIVNKTALSLSATDFSISMLADGSGVQECPLPRITSVSGDPTTVQFSFVPQRWGRDGRLQILWKGNPLFFEDNQWNRELNRLPNRTRQAPSPRSIDMSISRFIVQPGFASLDDYPYASLMRLGWFSPLTNWVLSTGVPMVNGTKAGEEQTVRLRSSVTTGTITQVASIPAGSTKCRFRVEYYFNATEFDYTTTQYIGRVALVARSSTVDLTTLRTFNLYSQGRTILVTGATRANGQDGDAYSWERLGLDFVVLPQYAAVRAELEAYHGVQRSLLFGNPYFQCSVHARTPPAEVAALQRIWTHVGQNTQQLTRWRNPVTNNFNGDPCINLWRGVTCRNLRVVQLDLSHSNLTGQWPPVPELSFLEVLDLRNNSLFGTFPKAITNNTRLTRAYLSSNRFSSIPTTAFSVTGNACLRSLEVSRNQLSVFPTQVIGHPMLEQLDLSFNNIRGKLPNFGVTSPLAELHLAGNQFSYGLPTLPENAMISVDLSANKFSGSIPAQWGNLRNVKYIDVSKNRLNGTVPVELGKIISGSQLTFRGFENYFSGLLPNLPFGRVDLRYNSFSCPLPLQYPFVRIRYVQGLDDMMCDYGTR